MGPGLVYNTVIEIFCLCINGKINEIIFFLKIMQNLSKWVPIV